MYQFGDVPFLRISALFGSGLKGDVPFLYHLKNKKGERDLSLSPKASCPGFA